MSEAATVETEGVDGRAEEGVIRVGDVFVGRVAVGVSSYGDAVSS